MAAEDQEEEEGEEEEVSREVSTYCSPPPQYEQVDREQARC